MQVAKRWRKFTTRLRAGREIVENIIFLDIPITTTAITVFILISLSSLHFVPDYLGLSSVDENNYLYQGSDGQTQIEVKFEQETVWLNRNQMAALFGRDVKTKHINNIFKDGELEKDSVVANIATTAADEKSYQVDHYNLDVIISVGYRVKSAQGTQFRQWATQRLKDYLVQGYAIT